MPRSTVTATVHAPAQEVWELIADPHHLPRWWPRVDRVEGVDGEAFTQVLRSERGRLVRADFLIVESDREAMRLVWSQQVAGTPFATVLRSAETELRLRELPQGAAAELGGAATEVTITLDQRPPSPFGGNKLPGGGGTFSQGLYSIFAHLGGFMVRRAAKATAREALDGLQRIAVR